MTAARASRAAISAGRRSSGACGPEAGEDAAAGSERASFTSGTVPWTSPGNAAGSRLRRHAAICAGEPFCAGAPRGMSSARHARRRMTSRRQKIGRPAPAGSCGWRAGREKQGDTAAARGYPPAWSDVGSVESPPIAQAHTRLAGAPAGKHVPATGSFLPGYPQNINKTGTCFPQRFAIHDHGIVALFPAPPLASGVLFPQPSTYAPTKLSQRKKISWAGQKPITCSLYDRLMIG